ncbi:MAG TPA: SDR family oxidoreductase [bacterium]|nr:SDR family oxidoreductase [bacterium]
MAQRNDKQFDGQVVWITGAGTGIGRAAALMFAREGATVALMGRRTAVLETVLREVRKAGAEIGAKAEAVPLDVADRDAVSATAQRLLKQWGRVDILVNNAGLNVPKRRLQELAPEDWDLVVHVNLTGAFNMVHAVLPAMRKQGAGLIINVSSVAGKQASGLSGAAYTASKHGMNGFNAGINMEEWKHGIRATVICPGEVNTEILDRRPIPVDPEERERLIAPEDLAEAIRFVAALPARTTITEMVVMPTHKRQFKPGEAG